MYLQFYPSALMLSLVILFSLSALSAFPSHRAGRLSPLEKKAHSAERPRKTRRHHPEQSPIGKHIIQHNFDKEVLYLIHQQSGAVASPTLWLLWCWLSQGCVCYFKERVTAELYLCRVYEKHNFINVL